MTCSNCVMHLEALEDELPGILYVRGSYQKQKIDLEYDENKVTENQIRQAIEEMGYHPE